MFRCLLTCLVAGMVALAGCVPESSSQDEERDAHVLAGKQRLVNRDIDGAIAEFEQALQVNPKNASAHFELAVVYKSLKNDDASAIYHYQKFIAVQPAHRRRPLAEQAIKGCRQDIAKAAQDSLNGSISRSYHEAGTINTVLMQRVQMLDAEVARLSAMLRNLGANQVVPTNYVQTPPSDSIPRQTPRTNTPPQRGSAPNPPRNEPPPAVPQQRTHTIKPGDTLRSLATQYRVPFDKLLAVNRSVDARKLKPGQTVVIPAP